MANMKALEGIKIVDFTWYAVGPLIGKFLADHGATTIKIESHRKVDGARSVAPHLDSISGLERSATFANWNTSKHSLSIDLLKPEGARVARDLIVGWADIVVESFTPGVMKKVSLDYESIASAKPEIIYLSTNQHGQDGPFSRFPGWGNMGTALTGMSSISGWPDRGPSPLFGYYMDYVAPKFGAIALLAALDRRKRTGNGLYIDLSQVETTLGLIEPAFMDYTVNGRIMGRRGNRVDNAVPHGAYPCRGKDRWIAIAIFTDDEWQALGTVAFDQEWVRDPKFATFLGRKKNEDELDMLLAKWTIAYTAEEIEAKLQASGVRASLVENGQDLFEDPQLNHRGFYRQFEHPGLGLHTCDGPPFHLSETPDTQFATPTLGQDNEYILKEILNMSDEEIAQLLIEGVITTDADLS